MSPPNLKRDSSTRDFHREKDKGLKRCERLRPFWENAELNRSHERCILTCLVVATCMIVALCASVKCQVGCWGRP
ncbi:hypothetical protein DP42_4719 [Burkholderia pseudomallei]|nr:hypothetical protein DO73_4195 [Burkholderia pseudomallei]KGD22378.1 hypothetical protein DP42_4719 [Burkholderia pseudomallei]